MTKRLLFIVAVTAIALGGFMLWQRGADNGEQQEEHEEEVDYENIPLTEKQVKAVDLRMGEVTDRSLDATLQANGSLVLRAQNVGEVSSLMGGIVKSILVKEGQRVSHGQVVATVENTDILSLQREYYSASKEAELSCAEMNRQQTLAASGAGVKKTLQQAQKQYQVAQANLTGIGRQLQQMGISPATVAQGKFVTVFPLRAPVDGTVSKLTATLGGYADMQTPLMTIRNNAAVECDLNVFEKDINKVKVGNPVLLSLTNQPGVAVSGRVYGMNEYFNDGTKSVAVHVKLDPTPRSAKLFDGMYVSGSIATGRTQCRTLPSKAIVTAEGKNYIFALNQSPRNGEYVFSRHEVTTGVSQDGYTEVALCKHIRKGQKIVTSNAYYLASLTGEHGEED